MPLPKKLTENLEKILKSYTLQELKSTNLHLMQAYQQERWTLSPQEKLCYAICRMPATYAVLRHILASLSFSSLLDVGAGPGTASWVVPENVSLHCLERDVAFISLAKQLGSRGLWQQGDCRNFVPPSSFDIVLFSYSLGEINALDLTPYWKACQRLVIIEPGTPKGWQNILAARSQCLALGGYVHAPCPHAYACPLLAPDWCHFGITLPRSPLHRLLKHAELNYEEEKFSYLIMGKERISSAMPRLLRPPQKRPGHIHLKLCMPEGNCEQRIVSKRTPDAFRCARTAQWGEFLIDKK